MCPHTINGSGDLLYRSWQMLLEFWARQICRELSILNFWPRFKRKTPETLNTMCVDILLRIPSNNCKPCSDNPSNSNRHCKMARGKILDGDPETYSILKTEEDLVWERNQDSTLKEKRMFCGHSRLDCMQKPEWGTCVTRPPQKWEVCLPKLFWGILDEEEYTNTTHKHTIPWY
jgi:hypothetical protein